MIHFDIKFTVRNEFDKDYLTQVYVKSRTQAIGFVLDSPVRKWRFRYGILPYREEDEVTLDNLIQLNIPPNGEEDFLFHGLYRPHHTVGEFTLKERLLINYRIYASSGDKKSVVDSRMMRLEIPFEDKVRLSKKS